MAACGGLSEAEQRHRAAVARAIADQPHEGLDRGAGRSERLRERFGRGPAFAAVGGHALGLVEGGGIEARPLGKPRGRQPGARRKPIQRAPDLLVGQHPLRFGLSDHARSGPPGARSGKMCSGFPKKIVRK